MAPAPVTPTGIISRPVAALRDMVAASASFQESTGSQNATEAKAFVHLISSDNLATPFVCIYPDQSFEAAKVGTGTCFSCTGRLNMEIIAAIDAEYQPDEYTADAYLSFTNAVGALISDLFEAGDSGTLAIKRITFKDAPARATKAKGQTEIHVCVLNVDYGVL